MTPKARIETTATIRVQIDLTEGEARALEAIMGYGCKGFLKTFYEHMGKYYLQPHEAGAESLFNSRNSLNSQLSKIDDLKKQFKVLFK